jgi:aryl-alcohol dehydrogenase-like predicted oxidoreductase
MKERRNGSRSVGEIGLGAGPLSDEGRPDEDRAIATIHAASKAGVSLIGAADSYAISDEDFGHSELIVRRAPESPGSGAREVLVATKAGTRAKARPGKSTATRST